MRQELFGTERLELHAQTLARAQPITATPPPVLSLHRRLDDNARVLLAAYRASAAELESGRGVVPAAEWLLDNYHLVEAQIREIRGDLPPGYYRQLPKLAAGPFAGYPRVFGLAWAFVAHTDSHFDPAVLQRFIAAYQRVQPLTIGELWAVAITLRIVLVENLRRLTDQISAGRSARWDAQALANRLLTPGQAHAALEADIASRPPGPLSELFAAQLAKRLRDQDPRTTPALGWLEERLQQQGTSAHEVVEHALQRQGASNVTVRNVITSMRLISDIDWAQLFESVSLVDEHLRAGSDFAAMDFATRNLYRSAIEQLARGSPLSELAIAALAVDACRKAAAQAPAAAEPPRGADPGYHLIDEGRRGLERVIGFKPPLRLAFTRFNLRLGMGGYLGAIFVFALALLAASAWAVWGPGASTRWLALFALAAFIPATEVATALVNRIIAWSFGAVPLPGLALRDGVPPQLRTLVAVPTLLTSEADLLEQIERLEVHHLSGTGGDLAFALLADGLDADQPTRDGDAQLVATAHEAVAQLNHRHGPGPGGGARFFFLHRRRVFNAGENKWMGWERKRGKLHELNRLLRGATDTTFEPGPRGQAQVPPDVRYVITLDADTRLPRDAALRLVGKMAHPLNRPRFSEALQRVVGGYGILQPRVTPSLPVGREGSFYQRLFSAPGGIDPYAAAASDVYQDLFAEGSYTGKGIYDVDAFEAALADRVPPNTLLSHDLFEGIFARAGLASDIEVIEEFPSRYDVAAKRQHRWTRGDWQLLPWILRHRSLGQELPLVGLGKMLDNLRRSLQAPLLLAALGMSWMLPLDSGVRAVLLVLAAIAVPAFLAPLLGILPRRSGIHLPRHLRVLAVDLRLALLQTFFTTAFLADQAWRMLDAIARTLVRLAVTRRRLLEWTTAAQSARAPRLDVAGFYRQMAGGTLLGLAAAAAAGAYAPASWPLVLPFALLWLAAPALALWSSRSPAAAQRLALLPGEEPELRLIARRTWRFFETFVTPAENMLPPDNFQEDPKPAVAHRTSPTNIGLYLLSAVAARDFGWAGTLETVERMEATFLSLQKLARFKGHFFNWYGTLDLQALAPAYVSSVDSGNFAGHLIVLANACEEWIAEPNAAHARSGIADHLQLARHAMAALPAASGEEGGRLAALLDEIQAGLKAKADEIMPAALKRLADKAAKAARELAPAAEGAGTPDLVFWLEAVGRALHEHGRDRAQLADAPLPLGARLKLLAHEAREMALAMDFDFLMDGERKLLSIGYSLADNRLDPSCYDLLASEARLASLFAIAKGDATTKHWFRLGRTATPLGHASALISWSGSMFEYLMPSLVMRAPAGSLLEQTNRLVVRRQQDYGDALDIPWGISESAYNARDMEFTYQYSNFGVPGLGLKRGLADNVVIAPYATGLAAMVDPGGALRNYQRLADMGASGRYGFYEALDFTPARLPDDAGVAIVRCFMAHHQGMTIVAIANALQDGRMRERFHREPMIQACELLLQERMPRDVAVAHPRAEEVRASPARPAAAAAAVRRLRGPHTGAPVTHLLSNGSYAVMLTASGAGYSRWRDIAVTRWREDATRDDWGSFVFLRDTDSGALWSASAQPLLDAPDGAEVVFGEDHAEFMRRDASLATSMEVLVSGEDDGEVRRLVLVNSGRRAREIELTSYAELVLATPASDNAHPAFSKLFVQTEFLPEFGALLATRRPRSNEEAPMWAAHFAVVEGEVTADTQYETDRARFLGRGNGVATAAAMTLPGPLSNTVGTVLDAVFSLRQRVRIAPGKVRARGLLDAGGPVARGAAAPDRQAPRPQRVRPRQDAGLDPGPGAAAAHRREGGGGGGLPAAGRAHPVRRPGLSRVVRSHRARWRAAVGPVAAFDFGRPAHRAAAHRRDRRHRAGPPAAARARVLAHEATRGGPGDRERARRLLCAGPADRHRHGGAQQPVAAALRRRAGTGLGVRAAGRPDERGRAGPAAIGRTRRPGRAARPDRRPARAGAPGGSCSPPRRRRPAQAAPAGENLPAPQGLEFFNGLGGFDEDGREYVTVLEGGATTPAPWINVVANAGFGFQASAEGSGYTWAENSRENQLTPWSNDPVRDPAGEALYVRDEDSGEVWTATAQPMRGAGRYIARHGFGYSRFEHQADGIALALLQYVPVADPVKISRLTLRNLSGVPRRLSVTAYAEWVLGTSRGASGPFICTGIDEATGAMLASNAWSTAFPGRTAFADLDGRHTAFTADRREFLGRDGGPAAPAGLLGRHPLSGASGAGLDPCAALQRVVEVGAGETVEVVFFLGQCESAEKARELVTRLRRADLDAMFTQVKDHWRSLLGAVQVRTPDRAMRHHAQRLAAVPDAGLPRPGALGVLPGQRRLRLSRPAAGRHGAVLRAAAGNPHPPAARGRPPVR